MAAEKIDTTVRTKVIINNVTLNNVMFILRIKLLYEKLKCMVNSTHVLM